MKIGFNEATALKSSTLEQDLLLTEKFGYDYIEIRLDMLADYLKKHTIDDLVEFFKNSHVKPYAINAIEPINFFEGYGLEKLKNSVRYACEVAQKINNPYIVVVPTIGNTVDVYSEEEIEDDSIRILNILADIGDEYGVKMAFEPIGSSRCSVKTIKQSWQIVKKVNRDSVGLVIDAFNLFLYDKLSSIEDIRQVDLEKIFVVHIDDSLDLPLEQLDHCHRTWPGDGVIPLKKMIEELQKLGYQEIVSVELFNPEIWKMTPEEIIKTGYEKVKNIIL